MISVDNAQLLAVGTSVRGERVGCERVGCEARYHSAGRRVQYSSGDNLVIAGRNGTLPPLFVCLYVQALSHFKAAEECKFNQQEWAWQCSGWGWHV